MTPDHIPPVSDETLAELLELEVLKRCEVLMDALIRELLARRKAMEEAPHAPSCESLNRFIHEQPCRFWTTGICLTEKDINGNIIDRSATCHAATCSCWKSKWSAK